MKQFLILSFLLPLLSATCFSQVTDIPLERQKQLDTLIELIKNDHILELASKISFPIVRPNPIPNLKNKDEFILYYPILFDADFKTKLTTTKHNSSNTIDKEVGFGFLNGSIWMDHDGKIMTINYNSKKEKELKKQLHLELENNAHKSINRWEENVLVCESDKFLIRIDFLENDELRYASWSKPKTISDKPDLILFQGATEYLGTMGGVIYEFKNKHWTYQIQRIQMAKHEEQCGLYLVIYQDKEEIVNCKMTEIK